MISRAYAMVASSFVGGAAIGYGLCRWAMERSWDEALASHKRALELVAKTELIVKESVVEPEEESEAPEDKRAEAEAALARYKSRIPFTDEEAPPLFSYIQAEHYFSEAEYEKHQIEITEDDGGRYFEIDGVFEEMITDHVGTSYFYDFENSDMEKYPTKDGIVTYVRNHEGRRDYEVTWRSS
jgi:hypothetical protein